MDANDRYDGTLQMFVEELREPDVNHLAFFRWLGERERLEHPVYAPASGDSMARRSRDEVTQITLAGPWREWPIRPT
jgi:hypothetical protein